MFQIVCLCFFREHALGDCFLGCHFRSFRCLRSFCISFFFLFFGGYQRLKCKLWKLDFLCNSFRYIFVAVHYKFITRFCFCLQTVNLVKAGTVKLCAFVCVSVKVCGVVLHDKWRLFVLKLTLSEFFVDFCVGGIFNSGALLLAH